MSFLVMTQLIRIAGLVAGSESSLYQVVEILGSASLSFLPIAAPLAIVFAANYSVGKMSSDSEIVALMSFGFSKGLIMRPFLIVGGIISLSLFLIGHDLVPRAYKNFKERVIDVTSKNIFTQLKSGQFFVDIPNLILFAQVVKDKGDKLEKIFIQTDKNKGKSEQLIIAENGVFVKQKRSGKELTRVRLILKKGNIFRTNLEKGKIEKVDFEEYEFPLFNNFYRKQNFTSPSMLSTWTLIERIKNNFYKGTSLNKAYIEIYSRMVLPLQCILFTLLGCIYGIRKNRGKSSNQNFILFLLVVLFHVLHFTAMSFVKSGKLHGSGFLIPIIVIGLFTWRQYKKLDWIS